jgi:hypothetical protein
VKKNDVESKEVKTGCNLAESSKKDHGSKRAVLMMMMVMMMMMIQLLYVSKSVTFMEFRISGRNPENNT